MRSPFPGLDPYIEASGKWADFHTDFLVGCREQLNQRLPDNYVASLNERIQLLSQDDRGEITSHIILPDVAVEQTRNGPIDPLSTRQGVATLEPHVLPQTEWVEPPTEVYIEITYVPEARVVTDIELLSPSNKRRGSEDRVAYLVKRKQLAHHQINLVEFDFLAQGERLQMLVPLPAGDCYSFITRAESTRQCEIYAWSYRDPLPTIPIPLRPQESDIALNLADVFQQTYERGRYERLLRYDQPPQFLPESQRGWAAKIVAGRSI
ncbi:MAG TPA: DUF4058 family protein [Humisphaera sp.]|jgi:hypothetical protein|nr:DUF4058 family protein [Humisphaera sp.]